jgi:translation initiation factor IF-1
MRTRNAWIIAAVLLLAASPAARAADTAGQKNISFSMTEAATLTAKVTDIDYQARTVQLTDAEGKVRTVHVSDAIRNFQQVQKGDTVTVEVQESLDVEVQQGPGEPMNIGSESQTSSLPGQKPAGIRTIEGKLKTRVEAIDYQARTITCKNRKGVLTTYKVGKDAKRFDQIRRGDMLVADYKQVTVLSVK